MGYEKIIIYLLVFVVIAFGGYLVYDKIYDYGYAAAEKKYTIIINEYNNKQDAKANSIQASINSLIAATTNYNSSLLSDMAKIQHSIATKPLVIYKDGKCELSPEFLAARTAAIERANKK